MVLIRIIHRFTTDFVTSHMNKGFQVRVNFNRKLPESNIWTLIWPECVQPHPKFARISPLPLSNFYLQILSTHHAKWLQSSIAYENLCQKNISYLRSKEYLTGSEPEVQIDLSWTDSGFVSYNRFISRKTKLFILCSDREHLHIFIGKCSIWDSNWRYLWHTVWPLKS